VVDEEGHADDVHGVQSVPRPKGALAVLVELAVLAVGQRDAHPVWRLQAHAAAAEAAHVVRDDALALEAGDGTGARAYELEVCFRAPRLRSVKPLRQVVG